MFSPLELQFLKDFLYSAGEVLIFVIYKEIFFKITQQTIIVQNWILQEKYSVSSYLDKYMKNAEDDIQL